MSDGIQMSLLPECQSPIEILLNQQKNIDERSPIVVAYGGGKNSTAMLIWLWKQGIVPDLILFADTGGEKPETYEFIEVFNQWLLAKGMPEITMLRKKASKVSPNRRVLIKAKSNLIYCLSKKCGLEILAFLIFWLGISNSQYQTLEEECLINQTLPSKAYGTSTCSLTWKIEPQDKYIEEWAIEHGHITQQGRKKVWDYPIRRMIGYHAGEVRRMLTKTGAIRPLNDGYYQSEYPLIVHNLDELACRILIISEGLPLPSKSSCFFCPNSRTHEIAALSPELKARALLIEDTWRNGSRYQENQIKGLGRRFAWGQVAELSNLEQASISSIQESQCGCIE